MTSSMLSGEKRWTSARRGGMTVLGKVAVPKPINLPSQRLENHGLDPNVEIVPKGTVSWGSRPSSSSSNAWSSSALSPNTDGGTGSPRHLSGRPSSGGSGTRPSTAGSDKAHEPIAKAWGSDSRPSSASGVLASTQTSLTPLHPRSAETRPRSAETRPRSSQLSRFAEPLSDKTMTWGASAAAEKLGVVSSKNDRFSLSAGDFPTLVSEKETSARNVESQDRGPYSRPGSSSGDTLGKEGADNSMGDIPPSANVKGGTGPPWRRDNFPYNEEGTRPVVEKWHADNQPYPNSSIPPQLYDGWHSGPPANNHPGGWYPGPPGGPPFGPPVPSGGFPMESFPYYRPQIPPGAGPRGPPPKNGDMYRPHLHDAYMRPGMPLRPGFYPGHLPYEGYYGPPMGFPNPNEPDIPFMGMPVAPASYNRFAEQHAPDTGNSHRRSSGYGPTGKAIVSEQVESGHSRDAQGPYRVLLKHRDGWEGNDEERKWDDSMIMKSSHPVKGEFPGRSSRETNDLRTDEKNHQEMDTRKMVYGDEVYSESASDKGGNSTKFKSPEDAGSSKVYDDSTVKKPRQMENAACAFPGSSIATSDSSLIQKIEGLNAKTRASDGRQDVKSAIGKVDCDNNLQTGNSMSNQSANEPVGVSLSVDRTHVSGTVVTYEHCSPADKNFKLMGASGTATTGISTNSMHVGADHRNKERFSTQEAERWRKRSHVADSSNAISSLQFGSSFVHGQDHTSVEVTERSRPYTPGRNDEDSVPHNADRTDSLALRAKMKELAKQRLKQREEEEEERTRDQKAKALAKLEELNRRSLVGEDTTQKSESAASAVTGDKQEERGSVTENTPASVAGANPSAVRATRDDKSIVMFSQVEESGVVINRSQPLQLDVSNANGASHSSSSKQKRAGYKQKQNGLMGNASNEKLDSSSKIEASKNAIDVVANATISVADVPKETESNCESCLTVTSSAMVEPSVHNKKKNRGGKNRQKAESSLSYGLPSIVSKDPTVLETSVESAKAETVESVLDPTSVQSFSQTEDVNVVLKKHLPIPNEEMQTKPINQWKSHHSRKMPRDIQANKSTEKSHNSDAVFWAPVLPRNKPEVADGTNQKSVVEVASSSIKSDKQGQNNPRNKRAEMERYVPKPVAKEMAQQGGTQQSLAPINNQSTPDEAVVKGESGSPGSSQSATAVIGKLLSFTESRNGDGRRNKSGKVHGSWRQRGSVESTLTNPGTSVPKSVDHDQCHSPDASSGKEYSSSNVEWSTSDGWNMPENCEDPVKMSFTKDHNVTGRVKRQAHKGHRGMRYNNDPDVERVNRLDSENFHALSSISEMQQADSLTTTKDNHSVGLSHWQPKTQGHSTTNQRGSRARSDHNIGAEIVKGNNRDTTPPSGVPLPPETDMEYTAAESKSYQDRSTSEKGDLEEARNDGHHEARRGRNVILHKGRPGSPVEQTFSADFRNEHRASSGFRKNVNQNSRFGKDSESHGDWSESGKDKKQHTVPANWQRQRHHSHFEYQPVGPQNSNKAKFEVSKDGSYNSGSRYRDKSNSYSRRGGGNFYGRQSGSSSQVESSYDYRPNSS